MPCVYILRSRRKLKRYVGSSHEDSALVRLRAHNARKVRSTKAHAPWDLIMTEHYNSYTEARKRELFLKTGAGRKWLDENYN